MTLLLVALLALSAHAQEPALTSLKLLERIGVKPIARAQELDVGLALLSETDKAQLLRVTHEEGKCGGFEVVTLKEGKQALVALQSFAVKNASFRPLRVNRAARPEIEAALRELKEENLKNHVEWLSSYPDRDNRKSDPNLHVRDLESRLKELLSAYPHPWRVDLISHQRTNQKSVRVHLEGKIRPEEIVVLGGHLDSINQSWGGGDRAPGADDNASGSANLMEALRVLITKGRPARSVEFFWYAGEESGLLGSSEIAQSYKAERKDVIAVLQLDMTLFPGAGELVIGNVNDNTSAWLRAYLEEINGLYIKARLIEDSCGYACSDHASWHRQGYPALMPFESDTDRMNRRIHSDRDVIDGQSNFRHSLAFSKIALVFAMDLANSTARQPY